MRWQRPENVSSAMSLQTICGLKYFQQVIQYLQILQRELSSITLGKDNDELRCRFYWQCYTLWLLRQSVDAEPIPNHRWRLLTEDIGQVLRKAIVLILKYGQDAEERYPSEASFQSTRLQFEWLFGTYIAWWSTENQGNDNIGLIRTARNVKSFIWVLEGDSSSFSDVPFPKNIDEAWKALDNEKVNVEEFCERGVDSNDFREYVYAMREDVVCLASYISDEGRRNW